MGQLFSAASAEESTGPSPFDRLLASNQNVVFLEKIFLSLDYESFLSCCEVSSAWNDLLTSESIRKGARSLFGDADEKAHKLFEEGTKGEVRRLLSSGLVDVNRILYGSTPLCLAVKRGHKGRVANE